MSSVTGLVLICSAGEPLEWHEHPPGNIARINQWLRSHDFQEVADIADEHATGNKHPQLLLYAAGYNYFPEDEFIDFFHTLRWDAPDRVILTVQPEAGPTRVVRPA